MEQLRELVPWIYFLAAITFILGLKGLSGPTTAQAGNRIAAAGMLLAVIATFLERQVASAWLLIVPAIAIGGVIGFIGARQVPMTAMPQMVAIFNGAGGGAAALVSVQEYLRATSAGTVGIGDVIAILLGLMIGGVSFSGSAVAFGKLQGLIDTRAFKYAGQQLVTGGLFAVMILGALALIADAAGWINVPNEMVLALVGLLSLGFGVALVMPIGGADMPVVISLLNAYTGLAVAMAGFSIGNQMLIIAGTLVGASGTLLTRLMSKAMNRSLTNVLFGAFGAAPAAGAAGAKTDDGRSVREISAEDAAIQLGFAQSVIIVPGYGLAVAQAQHGVRELADLLEAKGVEVRYAIHPVAGRMPGHMNVLLAEANVPYEKLFDMEQINDEFGRADVALVIGANDVTNPAARADKSSPIYGMPILNVDQAQNIIVIKRSMKPGFAGIDNELYLDPKTGMLFGDAKEAVGRVIAEVKKAG
ncbi:MAG: NAD(P)(+) transhydrogenase (Re/Si-specific) subunit beta [Chloroflexota bacterium]|nr:NAD(P)(+) transhydrogenase (Re/Si-specific) subunit beta [Chloroflexota bacterium]